MEQFLTAAGDYDLDEIQTMFSDKANINGASLRDGKWITKTYYHTGIFGTLKNPVITQQNIQNQFLIYC